MISTAAFEKKLQVFLVCPQCGCRRLPYQHHVSPRRCPRCGSSLVKKTVVCGGEKLRRE